jgi:alanine racemase
MTVSKKEREGLRTWIEVDRKAIRHNFGVFRGLISKTTKLMAVVKSNAYGHDLIQFSKEMEKLRADFLGVDSMTEARALRREGVKLPILVLGYTMPELFAEAAENDVSITVSTFETLKELCHSKLRRPVRIHIKVDTGMHRQGFLAGDLPKILGKLKVKSLKLKVQVEGLYTHFAAAKNPAFPKDTKDQIAEFRKWIDAFFEAGFKPILHAAATSGTLLFPESHFDMVRIGIGLYGLWPEAAVKAYLGDRIRLHPALLWKSIVTEVKELAQGSRIGYDLTETMPHGGTLAVVPVGYWHGYPRALSSVGRVNIGGKECRILGRVSMDMLAVDVSGVRDVRAGSEVLVLGGNDASPVSAEGVASLLCASWYEVITRLNPLIKRIYK